MYIKINSTINVNVFILLPVIFFQSKLFPVSVKQTLPT